MSGVFRVALFGHRWIDDMRLLEERLDKVLKKLFLEHTYIEFFIGRNGIFDEMTASVIKRLKKQYENENYYLVLVLPYEVKDMVYYANYYDEIIIPDTLSKTHYKGAIMARNQYMVDRADLVIIEVERCSGGAYAAMQYAKKRGKKVINLNDLEDKECNTDV